MENLYGKKTEFTRSAITGAIWLPTWKISKLNWKLKVSNTADNAGITQCRHVTLGIVECRN